MPLALPLWRVAATNVAATRQKKWILGGTKSLQTTLFKQLLKKCGGGEAAPNPHESVRERANLA